MISALSWVPPGVAKAVPEQYEPPEDERAAAAATEARLSRRSERSAAAGAPLSEEDEVITKLYGLDTYDDDEDEDGDGGAGGGMGSDAPPPGMFAAPDALMDTEDGDDDYEDASDIEDLTIKPTDSLLIAARAEGEESVLEVNVFDPVAANLYVHHDVVLSEMPLCSTWVNAGGRNMAAVGSFQPEIELFDLDVLDSPPLCTLRGNTGPVLCMSWLPITPSVLVNGSADHAVRGWDLSRQTCVLTLTHHTDKVQSVALCPVQPAVVASGGFDKRVVVADARAPDARLQWSVSADVENLCWNPAVGHQVFTATEDGNVTCHDARTTKPLFFLKAHDQSCAGVAFTSRDAAPGTVLVTVSPDKTMALWDTTLAPLLVAAGSAKGKLAVWDGRTDDTVAAYFASRQ